MLATSANVGARPTVNRSWLNDSTLTCKAKGLLDVAAELDQAGDPITVKSIMSQCSDSKGTVTNALFTLVAAGHLTRHEVRSHQRGRPEFVYRFPPPDDAFPTPDTSTTAGDCG